MGGMEGHRGLRQEEGKGPWLQSGTHGARWHILWVARQVEAGHSAGAPTHMVTCQCPVATRPRSLQRKTNQAPKETFCSKVFPESTEDTPQDPREEGG